MRHKKSPDHERLGYGRMPVGETISFRMDCPAAAIRNRMASYSAHKMKKFRTRTDGQIMFVERVM